MINGDYKLYNRDIKDRLSNCFHCSNFVLDNFIKDEISLDDKYGKTYVFLSENEDEIIAYFNITSSLVIDVENNISAGGSIYIRYFALDNNYHDMPEGVEGIKVSDLLLEKCLNIIKNIRKNNLGFLYITLHATKMGYSMYKRRGFLDAEDDIYIPSEEKDSQNPMVLVLDDINE